MEQELMNTEEEVYRMVENAVREDKSDFEKVVASIAILILRLNTKPAINNRDVMATTIKIKSAMSEYEERSVLRFEQVLGSVSKEVYEKIRPLFAEHFSQFDSFFDKWHTNKNAWIDNFKYSVARLRQKIIKSLIVNANYMQGDTDYPLNTETIMSDMNKSANTHMNTTKAIFHDESQYVFMGTVLLALKANGYTHFKFKAVMDDRTSDICRSMNGRVYPISAWKVGVTVPPLHYRCRSICYGCYKDGKATKP